MYNYFLLVYYVLMHITLFLSDGLLTLWLNLVFLFFVLSELCIDKAKIFEKYVVDFW